LGSSDTNLQNGISNTSAKKGDSIVISNTNWYFECRLVLQIPIVTSNTNRVTIHQEEKEEKEQQQSGY
jgi:hypothetical protein